MTAVPFILPVFGWFVLRRLTSVGMGFDYVGSAPGVLLVFILLWRTRGEQRFSFQPVAAAVGLVAIAGYWALNSGVAGRFGELEEGVRRNALLVLGSVIVGGAFFLWLDPLGFIRALVRRRDKWIWPLALLPLARIEYLLWPLLCRVTTRSVFWLLKGCGLTMVSTPDPYIVEHPLVTIRIWALCSGLQGMTFFILIFSLLVVLDPEKYSTRKILATYFLGLVYMFLLNILRITAYFMFSIHVTQLQGETAGAEMIRDLFHNHVGWVIYTIGIGAFFVVFFWITEGRKSRVVPGKG